MVGLLLGLHLSCYTGNSGKHSMILFKGRTQSGQKLAVSVCMAAGIQMPCPHAVCDLSHPEDGWQRQWADKVTA